MVWESVVISAGEEHGQFSETGEPGQESSPPAEVGLGTGSVGLPAQEDAGLPVVGLGEATCVC